MANIELVIKIPEDEYRWIKKSDETAFANVASKECMLHAIKTGTLLPKGHGRLIDADAMTNRLSTSEASEFFGGVTCAEISDFINDEETIIEADKESEVEE